MDFAIEKKAYELYDRIMADPKLSIDLKKTIQPPYIWLQYANIYADIWGAKISSWDAIIKYNKYMINIAQLSGRLDRMTKKKLKKRTSV